MRMSGRRRSFRGGAWLLVRGRLILGWQVWHEQRINFMKRVITDELLHGYIEAEQSVVDDNIMGLL
jgi:hypothetical protein